MLIKIKSIYKNAIKTEINVYYGTLTPTFTTIYTYLHKFRIFKLIHDPYTDPIDVN